MSLSRNGTGDNKIRVERYKHPMSYTDAFKYVSDFYARKPESGVASQTVASGTPFPSSGLTQSSTSFLGKLMAGITDFPRQVVALAECIKYLSAFNITDALLATEFYSTFTTRTHMLLNGNTLTNLWVSVSKCVMLVC